MINRLIKQDVFNLLKRSISFILSNKIHVLYKAPINKQLKKTEKKK